MRSEKDRIFVTKTYLPNKAKFNKYLNKAWDRNWITNNGILVKSLEQRISEELNSCGMLYVANGTIALQLALKSIATAGRIITTPFSYVATTSATVWENFLPVFADVDPSTFNINPEMIEAQITEDTVAILATHCFGNSCDIEALEAIAFKYGLKLIFDASHCFGTKYKKESIFNFGTLSTCSFHATKIFHTVEGGGIFCQEPELQEKIKSLRNFGHQGPESFDGLGINGKNSEFHAAMGHAVLDDFTSIFNRRKRLFELYLDSLNLKKIKTVKIQKDCSFNYAYFPAVFSSEEVMLSTKRILERNNIFARRYFYPSLNKLPYVCNQSCEVAEDIASRILCLPLYHDLSEEKIKEISKTVNNQQ